MAWAGKSSPTSGKGRMQHVANRTAAHPRTERRRRHHRRPGRHGEGPQGHACRTRSPSPSRSRRATTARSSSPGPTTSDKIRALHGLTRTLIANMVAGVTEGYNKTLEIVGVGYRVQAKGSSLEFALGLQPPGDRRRPRGHHLPRRDADPVRRARASTSRRSARSPRTSASSASPTRTRARACATRAKSSAARSERLVSRHGWQDMRPASTRPRAPSRGPAGTAASARRSTARPTRPRLVVNRSTRHIFVQIVDDTAGHTLASASTLDAALRTAEGDKTAKAQQVGELLAQRAKAAGHRRGRVRPRRQPLPRPHRGPRGRRPRRRAGVLMTPEDRNQPISEKRNH